MGLATGLPDIKRLRLISGGWRDYALVVLVFLLLLPLSLPRIYATDEVQYYAYLRSLYFDGDLFFENEYRHFAAANPASRIEDALLTERRLNPETGRYGNVAPVGAALLWAPFFVLADGLVLLANLFGAGIARDGYSQPYVAAVCYASALYGLLGLLLTLRLARGYASSFAATLATLTIWLATPLFWYMFIHMPWSHAPAFFLVALFLTIWQRTRGPARGLGAWLALGAVGALMTMAREQLGLFLLVPAIEALTIYWGILTRTPETLGARLRRATRLLGLHLAFLLAFAICLLPQILVYRALNERGMPSSEVADKLKWCSPHLIDTLVDFDPRPEPWCELPNDPSIGFPPLAHGAFVWSPILPFALLGLVLLWRRDRLLCVALALAFLGQTYLNGVLSTWHLTAAFGFRRLIECTPIFVIGLALLADRLSLWRGRGWIVVAAGLFVGWNFALALNWALLRPEIRQGLIWPDLIIWQLEAPLRAVGKLRDLVFNPCRFFENGRC
jgi:hypothetical protein